MQREYDVLVVGGCTAGLYFAALMAQQGYRTLLIEKDSEGALGKRYDIFHLDKESFERFGIDLPKQGSEEYVRQFSRIVSCSALNRYPKVAHHEVYVLHRHAFMNRLKQWAISKGVEVLHKATFSSLLFDSNGRISGASFEHGGKTTNVCARLVADASGIASVVRTSLPDKYGVENFVIGQRDKFYVVLYYVMLDNPDQDRFNETLGWPYYKTWKAPQTDADGAIFGVGANLSFEYAENCFKRFAGSVLLPPHTVQRVEKDCSPYRRPPYSFVADGFVSLGDASCLTNPRSGEGITAAWVHAKIAAEEAGRAMRIGYPTRQALWPINTRYYTAQGAEFAQTLSMLAGAVSCSPEENDYEFSKGIIFVGDDEKDTGLFSKIIKGVITGKLRFRTLSSLIGAAIIGGKIRKHYVQFPKSMKNYTAWQLKADALWAKTRGMADEAEKDVYFLNDHNEA